jgi:M6 family metalloprotease-like protein
MRSIISSWFFLIFVVLTPLTAPMLVAAPLKNHPITLSQPNGVKIHCFISGDEYFHWVHDKDGYTIVQDLQTAYYTYAVLVDGLPAPSRHIAGEADPAAAGFVKYVLPSKERMAGLTVPLRGALPGNQARLSNAPTKGTISNIVVFVRFSDEAEFSRQVGPYESMFNSNSVGANSLRNYYREVSYTKLTINSSFYPAPAGGVVVSYQDSHPRRYYQPYSSTNPEGYKGGNDSQERADREWALVASAINAIRSQVSSTLIVDSDGDGCVDDVCVIIKGQADPWGSILYPHQWASDSLNVSINGKQAYTYNIQVESIVDSQGVFTLCHEMGHSLGVPDLYNYYSGGFPVTSWDVMADGMQPVHMGAYIKYRYCKWIESVPTINPGGTSTINPLTSSTQNVYRINSPRSSTEYYIVEFRKKTSSFENRLPGEGLIFYRINTAMDGQGNWNGPPDEVYIYRALKSGNLWYDNIENAYFSAEAGRVRINHFTDPSGFLSDGSAGGLDISNISAVGDTMSFTLGSAPPAIQAQAMNLSNSTSPTMCNLVRLYLSVRNTGSETLPSTAAVWFWVEGPGITEHWAASMPVAGLSYASTKDYYFDWKIPCVGSPGPYTIWARVYTGSTAISEWSSSTSFTPGSTAVQAQITSLYPVSNATVGAKAVLWAQVKNTGSTALPSDASVWFWVSGSGVANPWVGSSSVAGLAVGKADWFSCGEDSAVAQAWCRIAERRASKSGFSSPSQTSSVAGGRGL